MYSRIQFAKKYLQYYFKASNGSGHGIHSPFVFDFIKNVLNDKQDPEAYTPIEILRKQLLQDETKVEVKDFGAGSAKTKSHLRSVSEIVKNSAVGPKLGQLLFRISKYYQPKTIVELGTSLGLSAAYLASGNRNASLITIEGSGEIASVADKNFDRLGLKNVQLIRGNFDDQLLPVIDHLSAIDMAYIDGNHRMEPVLRYFNMFMEHMADSSMIVFDDIHWSNDMEEAWAFIQNDSRVKLTVDLFFFGVIFFRNEFKVKQDFIIRF